MCTKLEIDSVVCFATHKMYEGFTRKTKRRTSQVICVAMCVTVAWELFLNNKYVLPDPPIEELAIQAVDGDGDIELASSFTSGSPSGARGRQQSTATLLSPGGGASSDEKA